MCESDETQLIPAANQEIIRESGADMLLQKIRPYWQAKNLIQRVNRLLAIDPSSACQRILNAAIHDLKEKIIVAGLDIASEAARQNKMPAISKAEDVEEYKVSRVIHLSYRMGLLSRPEWRRLLRAYDIRRDIEHEDDEYEATIEDCLYIFKTCIEIVLSRDPVYLLKITDVKEIVENSAPAVLGESVIEDYKQAPQPRQLEIYRFLISTALNNSHPDIIRQNSYNVLGPLQEHTDRKVIIQCSDDQVKKLGRRAPNLIEGRVFLAAGIFPYLKKAMLVDFFRVFYKQMDRVGHAFRGHSHHGELLRNLQESGGLNYCPDKLLPQYVKWLVLCYIGERSFGQWGNSRQVFYSNTGAPLAYEILRQCQKEISENIKILASDDDVSYVCRNEYVSRRYQELLDITEN